MSGTSGRRQGRNDCVIGRGRDVNERGVELLIVSSERGRCSILLAWITSLHC